MTYDLRNTTAVYFEDKQYFAQGAWVASEFTRHGKAIIRECTSKRIKAAVLALVEEKLTQEAAELATKLRDEQAKALVPSFTTTTEGPAADPVVCTLKTSDGITVATSRGALKDDACVNALVAFGLHFDVAFDIHTDVLHNETDESRELARGVAVDTGATAAGVAVTVEGDSFVIIGATGRHTLDIGSTDHARLTAHVLGFIERQPKAAKPATTDELPDLLTPEENAHVDHYRAHGALHDAHVEAHRAIEPPLPTTADGIIANFEGQIVALRAALANAAADCWVLECQGLYIRIDGRGKAHACGVLQADQMTHFEAELRAPQMTNGNDVHPTVRSLPEGIRLSIAGLETCIASIRAIAA